MPSGTSGQGRRPTGADVAGPLLGMKRQIRDIKRQQLLAESRSKVKVEIRPRKPVPEPFSAPPVEPELTPRKRAKVEPLGTPVRLRKAHETVARRLGVPLRGDEATGCKRRAILGLRPAAQDSDAESPQRGRGTLAEVVGAEDSHGSDTEVPRAPGRAKVQLQGRVGTTASGDVRSRKMLGSMLTHLAAARRRLVEEKKPGRRAVELSAAARTAPSCEKIAALRGRGAGQPQTGSGEGEEPSRWQAGGQDDDGLGEKPAAQHKDIARLQRWLEGHYSLMKNFIRTRAEPTIFYLPAKLTAEAQRELDENQAQIEQKIKSLRTSFGSTD